MKKILLSILLLTNASILFPETPEKLFTMPSEERLREIIDDRDFDDTNEDQKNTLLAELSGQRLPINEVEKKVKQFVRDSREKQIGKLPRGLSLIKNRIINLNGWACADSIHIMHAIVMESPEVLGMEK